MVAGPGAVVVVVGARVESGRGLVTGAPNGTVVVGPGSSIITTISGTGRWNRVTKNSEAPIRATITTLLFILGPLVGEVLVVDLSAGHTGRTQRRTRRRDEAGGSDDEHLPVGHVGYQLLEPPG